MFAREVATDTHKYYWNVFVNPVPFMPGFYQIVSQDKQEEHIINGARIAVILPGESDTGHIKTIERH